MTEDKLSKAREQINDIDHRMAELFERRMEAVSEIALYKKENGLPILDSQREAEVIERNCALVTEGLRDYYKEFLKRTMSLSRGYQSKITEEIYLNHGNGGYSVSLGRGYLGRASEIFNLERKVFILTDSGVPKEYAEAVKAQSKDGVIFTIPCGEGSKCVETLSEILLKMQQVGITRGDCLVATGGGVVSDIGGFAASCYMRGIDFYNIPTTLLSQVDSSIGGKTGINFGGVKNTVGAFYQPKGVIIDPDLIKTLPERQMANGMAEVIKMALCFDYELFRLIEDDRDICEIISRAIKIKLAVVEADEREGGLRRVLNFGHTVGHGIEATDKSLYHGECVALGMLYMVSPEVRERLIPLLERKGLPVKYHGDMPSVAEKIRQDKKRLGDEITVIYVDKIGEYRTENIGVESFISRILED